MTAEVGLEAPTGSSGGKQPHSRVEDGPCPEQGADLT